MKLRKRLCWLLGHDSITEWVDNEDEGSHLQYIYCVHCGKVFHTPEDSKRIGEMLSAKTSTL